MKLHYSLFSATLALAAGGCGPVETTPRTLWYNVPLGAATGTLEESEPPPF
jgi:hypothetical protein